MFSSSRSISKTTTSSNFPILGRLASQSPHVRSSECVHQGLSPALQELGPYFKCRKINSATIQLIGVSRSCTGQHRKQGLSYSGETTKINFLGKGLKKKVDFCTSLQISPRNDVFLYPPHTSLSSPNVIPHCRL